MQIPHSILPSVFTEISSTSLSSTIDLQSTTISTTPVPEPIYTSTGLPEPILSSITTEDVLTTFPTPSTTSGIGTLF